MANERQPGRALRLGLEVGAIFLGVTLGFLADDYRDYLNDRSLETESLQQIVEDLRLDHEEMAPMVGQTQAMAEATRWITNRTASGRPPADSLAIAVDSLRATPIFPYEPIATAYSGLESTGRIDLIQNPDLKSAIVGYYEGAQPLIVTMNIAWQNSLRRWWDRTAGHMEVLETESDQRFPDLRVADLDEFVSDRRVMFAAGQLSGHSLELQFWVIRALARNEDLAAQVEDYLAAR